MFPLSLDLSKTYILLVGNGERTLRRQKLLQDDGAKHVERFSSTLPTEDEIKSAHVLLIADLTIEQAAPLAALARKHRVLVNVEDQADLCDFHFTSFIRRKDLLLSVSTGGKSPALAVAIRQYLEETFTEEWADILHEIASEREAWKAQGQSCEALKASTEALLKKNGWLSRLTSRISEDA